VNSYAAEFGGTGGVAKLEPESAPNAARALAALVHETSELGDIGFCGRTRVG
jgi:hypothetical protein